MAAAAVVTSWSTMPSFEELTSAAAVEHDLNRALEREHRTNAVSLPWRRAFLARAIDLMKGPGAGQIRRAGLRHVASSAISSIDRFVTSEFASRSDFMASNVKNQVMDDMRTFFDPDASMTTLGTDLSIGIVLFEGRMHHHVGHELRTREEVERRGRTCSSLSVSSALCFASWYDAKGLEEQRAALLSGSESAPLLYVHKIASPGVMGVLVDGGWLVGGMDIMHAITREKEVILSPFLAIDIIKEEFRLLHHYQHGKVPQLYRVIYTHVTLPGEACAVCAQHEAEDNATMTE